MDLIGHEDGEVELFSHLRELDEVVVELLLTFIELAAAVEVDTLMKKNPRSA